MDADLFRTRVAVLWVAAASAWLGSLLLYVFQPGAVEELLAGEMEGETLTDAWGYFFAAVAIFPVVMAAVTLLVSDRVNRYVNAVAGLAVGLFGVYAVGGNLADGDFNAHVLMAAVAGAVAFLIAGLALVGRRQPTPPEAARGSERAKPRKKVTA